MNLSWVAFTSVLALAYFVPGPDFLLVLHWGTRSRHLGLAAGLGAQAGLTVHVSLAVLGLTAAFALWPPSLSVIRATGAAYLVWLGARLALARKGGASAAQIGGGRRGWAVARQACGTNLLNPKAIIFVSSVLPQFAAGPWPVPAQLLLLGVIDVLAGLLVWTLVATLGWRLGGWLTRPAIDRWWCRGNGVLLCALAGGLLLAGV